MNSQVWKVPVRVLIDGAWMVLRGPNDALAFIGKRWPCREGNLCQRAKSTCYRSFRKSADPDESRLAFVAAAVEADLLFI